MFKAILPAAAVMLVTAGCGDPEAEHEAVLHSEAAAPEEAEADADKTIVKQAADQQEFEASWDHFGLRGDSPSIQWEEASVLFLTSFGSSSCPPVIQDMMVDDQTLSFDYLAYDEECTTDLQANTIVLQVDHTKMEEVETVLFQGEETAVDEP
ncbi:hypothetical protein [Alkalicoccus chagannorensis]|uniref:hypothetical protein n=1 Tax=Alkalicoccus chagannorensis TaxID=427072 RepID=UPI0012EC9E15|nr:hypothetical protein [Alkalicoccus chagannorensis]